MLGSNASGATVGVTTNAAVVVVVVVAVGRGALVVVVVLVGAGAFVVDVAGGAVAATFVVEVVVEVFADAVVDPVDVVVVAGFPVVLGILVVVALVVAAIVVTTEIVEEGVDEGDDEGVVIDTGGNVGATVTAAEVVGRGTAVVLVEAIKVELLVEVDEVVVLDALAVPDAPAADPAATSEVEGTVGTTPKRSEAGSGIVGTGSFAGNDFSTEPALPTVVSITSPSSWSTATPLTETVRTPQRADSSERSWASFAGVSTRPVAMESRPSKRICTPRIFV